MAYTQADADSLQKAIASGVRRVRYSDNSEVEYASLSEMRNILAEIEASLTPGTTRYRSFRTASSNNGYS